ncbi:hypothetical protein Hamer_G012640 [Homarus americanus]|uniref:Uncharacterized protein n=1 Tax=Homarus americanus TaxID=6706 RepID=A0A8J5MQZ2_HOMAM|nr:hypothetical protein Hamer_G012640 [Homarus americanus]
MLGCVGMCGWWGGL